MEITMELMMIAMEILIMIVMDILMILEVNNAELNIGKSVRRSSRSAFGQPTGNDVSLLFS